MAWSTSCARAKVATMVTAAVMAPLCSAQNESAMGRSTTAMGGTQAISRRRIDGALRSAGATFVWTRLLVFVVALLAVAAFGVDASNESLFDAPGLTHPFLDSLFSP